MTKLSRPRDGPILTDMPVSGMAGASPGPFGTHRSLIFELSDIVPSTAISSSYYNRITNFVKQKVEVDQALFRMDSSSPCRGGAPPRRFIILSKALKSARALRRESSVFSKERMPN